MGGAFLAGSRRAGRLGRCAGRPRGPGLPSSREQLPPLTGDHDRRQHLVRPVLRARGGRLALVSASPGPGCGLWRRARCSSPCRWFRLHRRGRRGRLDDRNTVPGDRGVLSRQHAGDALAGGGALALAGRPDRFHHLGRHLPRHTRPSTSHRSSRASRSCCWRGDTPCR